MRRFQVLFLIAVILTMALPAWSASLEEASQLQEAGKTQEALAAIESVLSSTAGGSEKAGALDLLGTIAVDQGQLALAKQAWTRLVDEYPDYAGSHDTATKLSLVSALLKSDDSAPVAPVEAGEPASKERAVDSTSAAGPSTADPNPAPAAAPSAAPPAVAATPAAPAPAATAASGVVLVAARGKPHDAVRELSDRIVEFLRGQGVDAQSATGGIPVVEESKMVLPMLLQKGQQDNAGSVLLLTADFVSMQKVALDCYMPAGTKLWKVKVSGGTGWKGRPYSKSGITEELAERFLEKLEAKVGEPGLPLTLK